MTTSSGDAWFNGAPERSSRLEAAFWCLLLGYGVVAWWLFGDLAIGSSWRECDTQAMARSLAQDFDLLRPRVDWRGITDGGVESEFPLYAAAIAGLQMVCGDVEWPGRLVSLVATLGATAGLFVLLRRRSGGLPAFLGAVMFLGGAQACFIGTRVMPDATSTAFAIGGLTAFVAFMGNGGTGWLALACVGTVVGILVKPTAAQVLMLQFAWLWLLRPAWMRDWRPWLGWCAVVLVAATWVLHARAVGQSTGLSFGVTFGDTKTPDLEHLLRPSVWRGLFMATASYGMSWYGLAAMTWLVVRRRFDRCDAALLVVVGSGLVGSLRYSHQVMMGPQYHVWSAIAGGWFVARVVPRRLPPLAFAACLVVLVGAATLNVQRELAARLAGASSAHLVTAVRLRELSDPADLVVVRGPKPRFDSFWRRANNFEEPVLLYQSHRKGWILPVDGVDAASLEAVVSQGARWYVETATDEISSSLAPWLATHARLVASPPGARIYRLSGS